MVTSARAALRPYCASVVSAVTGTGELRDARALALRAYQDRDRIRRQADSRLPANPHSGHRAYARLSDLSKRLRSAYALVFSGAELPGRGPARTLETVYRDRWWGGNRFAGRERTLGWYAARHRWSTPAARPKLGRACGDPLACRAPLERTRH